MTVGIYVRLSKEDLHMEKEESESIENQRKMLSDFAAKRGWEIYKVYSDDNESGKFSDEEDLRDGFRRLINDAKRGCFDCVLCKTQSRFSRNAAMVEKYVEHLFPQWGIRFVTVVDNADNFDRRNKKARQINSLVNEWFLEDLSENIKEVYRYKMKKGEYLASMPPFGYVKDKFVKNHLVPCEKYSLVVKEIFDMYASGMCGEKIADILNEKDIPSPGLTMGKSKNPWRSDSVYRILHNRVYIGSAHQHKEETYSYKTRKRRQVPQSEQIEVKNTHTAIIDENLFNLVQEKLKKKGKSGKRSTPVFSGILICGECMKNMNSNLNSYKKRYYRCRNKLCPEKKGISEEFIKKWVSENPASEEDLRIKATYKSTWSLQYCVNG